MKFIVILKIYLIIPFSPPISEFINKFFKKLYKKILEQKSQLRSQNHMLLNKDNMIRDLEKVNENLKRGKELEFIEL
jgi:hypothetical protein